LELGDDFGAVEAGCGRGRVGWVEGGAVEVAGGVGEAAVLGVVDEAVCLEAAWDHLIKKKFAA